MKLLRGTAPTGRSTGLPRQISPTIRRSLFGTTPISLEPIPPTTPSTRCPGRPCLPVRVETSLPRCLVSRLPIVLTGREITSCPWTSKALSQRLLGRRACSSGRSTTSSPHRPPQMPQMTSWKCGSSRRTSTPRRRPRTHSSRPFRLTTLIIELVPRRDLILTNRERLTN